MRREASAEIAATLFDAVIVGAGINGCGIARDAAMRGLKVLVLDKGDISAGTSAWSTRLIHGGLRYLEHGEVALVRESLRERERLFRIAPHLVRPLPMLIPLYAEARRGPLVIRAGMLAYDLLSFDKTLPRHRMLSRAETLRRAPGLRSEALRGAALYYDAQVEFPERLALENILSAREHGAQVLTYARVERVEAESGTLGSINAGCETAGRINHESDAGRGIKDKSDGDVNAKVAGEVNAKAESDGPFRVVFKDLLTGDTHEARTRLVVNVTGPWVDEVLSRTELHRTRAGREQTRLVGGTKGSHVVVEAFEGAPRDALYAEAGEDGRPFFIIPWNARYLIGTTDTRYEGDLDAVAADEAEIEYLLRETNRLLPRARLTRDSVLFTYAGVRPLPFVRGRDEASVTRRHFVRDHAPEMPGLVSIVGGKLTTYRHLAELAVNLLFKKLGRKAPPCATAESRLPGARVADFAAFGDEFKKRSALPEAVSERLLRIYGARAGGVLEVARESPDLRQPLSTETGALGAEVVFSFRHELAQTLTDCLWRRTMIGLTNPATATREAERAALIARKHLGWDDARAARERAACLEYAKRFHTRRTT